MKKIFIHFVLFIVSTFFLNSFAQADATPTPYISRVTLGDILDPNHSANSNMLERYVEAITNEGWQINLTPKIYIAHTPYNKTKDETLSDIVVNKTKGCKVFDDNCVRYIGNLNIRQGLISDEYEGVVLLPTQHIDFDISINAGNNYKEERDGSLTKAVISKRLHNLNQMIFTIAYSRINRICFDKCTELYQLTIE